MNIKEIEQVLKLMDEHNLNEFDLEKEEFKIHLSKGAPATATVVQAMPAAAPAPVAPAAAAPAAAGADAAPAVPSNQKEIPSPMVGTFYRAPSPEAQPFVKVGQMVDEDTTVCIIEAMKVINEIKAEMKGKIVEILIENAEPVEFGQAMFRVEPV